MGLSYILKALGVFYSTPKYYHYMAIPLAMLLGCYMLVGWGIYLYLPELSSLLPEPENWPVYLQWLAMGLKWVLAVTFFLVVFVALGVLSNSLFEGFGALFFDSLVGAFEEDTYAVLRRKIPLRESMKCTLWGICYALGTLIVSIFGLIVGLFVPVGGFLIAPALSGYRIGRSYFWSPLLTHGTLDRRRKIFAKNRYLIWELGFFSSLILSIPFVGIAVVPGFVLAGSMIYNEQLEGVKQ